MLQNAWFDWPGSAGELLATLALSWALLALIWVVQLVHYPAFRDIDPAAFVHFHGMHTASITWVVMPLMLAELGLAMWLAAQYPAHPATLAILALVGLVWLATFWVQVPLHNALAAGKQPELIERLVYTNWQRTLLWTLKALLVSALAWVWAARAAG